MVGKKLVLVSIIKWLKRALRIKNERLGFVNQKSTHFRRWKSRNFQLEKKHFVTGVKCGLNFTKKTQHFFTLFVKDAITQTLRYPEW